MKTATQVLSDCSGRFEWGLGKNNCIDTAEELHVRNGARLPAAVRVKVAQLYADYPEYKDIMAQGNEWILNTWREMLAMAGWERTETPAPGTILLSNEWKLARRYGTMVAFMADDFCFYSHSLDKPAMTAVRLEWIWGQVRALASARRKCLTWKLFSDTIDYMFSVLRDAGGSIARHTGRRK